MKISRTIPIFLISAVLVFGTTISMGIPASFAEPQYNYDKNQQYNSYGKDNYDKKKASSLNLKVNCNNVNNIIINGVDKPGQETARGILGGMTNEEEDDGTWQEDGQWLGNGDEKKLNNIDNNIVNVCINKNNIVAVAVAEEEGTGSLTVKKEIFGCDNMDEMFANCQPLQNNSPDWISCDNPTISNNVFCQELSEDLFDIEVLDEQNNQIQQFEGSQQGTTIQNLEPGTYTVNEIKHQSSEDQLGESAPDQIQCNNQQNFPEGGELIKQNPMIDYSICFEYEDEQGNDCTTTAIAVGEDKTCIVKNYISEASIELLPP